YEEVITPVVEHYELLAAKIGEENRKRMYVFEDLGGRKVALRPEFTASVARLVATKMRYDPKPIRLFCVGTLYRYDEPQSGRYREFWQANYELIGSDRPEADAEILALTGNLMESLNLSNCRFKIGHVGILRSILTQEGIKEERQNVIMELLDRKKQDKALQFLEEIGGSRGCINVLRNLIAIRGGEPEGVIQEIREVVKGYGMALTAAENLRDILNLMRSREVKFEMSVEAGFARGLEYYTGMIFEAFIPEISVALGGGGRYDRLIELFGGESTPAVGVALGMDRFILGMEKQGVTLPKDAKKRVLVVPVVDEVRGEAFEVSLRLRRAGIHTEVEVMGRSVSKALSDASRRDLTHVIIVGPKELEEGKIVLRDMEKQKQKTLSIQEALEEIDN
ncbi:MAG: histidine--tRNA ligase, partial [Candidatus Bathyarchaeia archaeon]